ncbi:MAG: transposase [Caldilineaceae bacterium]
MPRRAIPFAQGQYYHIYNRGASRRSIFLSDADYRKCISTMKKVATECKLSMIAYCLLPNHYHWFVRQDGEVAANQLPKRVFGSYSQAFNLKYQGSGTLFEDRFKVRIVTSDEYLRHLCLYIHGNPVKDRFALAPELWPYSNYLDWIGVRNGELVDHAFIQTFFPDLEQYKKKLLDYLTSKLRLPSAINNYLATLWD